MATYVPAKRGVEYIFYIALRSQADSTVFQVNPTIAAGDFKVSIDGGATANPSTLPAVTPAGGKAVKVTLSASEMTGDNIAFYGSDAAGAEWMDFFLNIQTSARQIDDLAYPTTSGRSVDVTTTGEVGLDFANINFPLGGIPALGIVDNGTLQSATATTAVLRSAASFGNSRLVGATLLITGGTGVGQSRVITAYVDATDTATVDTWDTTPDNTSTYVVFAGAPASATSPVPANVLQISNDTTAADNAESFFDGTGYAGTNNVIPLVTTATNLTNAPTSGDFTATMKTSIGTAVAASAVASVTGNVGGNVVGSVGSLAAQAKLDVNAEVDTALTDVGLTAADGVTRIAGVDLQQGGTGGQSVGA